MMIPAARSGAIRDVYIDFTAKPDMTPAQAIEKLVVASRAK